MRPAQEGAQFLNLSVGSICGLNPICGDTHTTIRQAAEIMAAEEIGSLFINSPEGHLMGVVTERDLTHKVVARGLDIDLPAVEIMCSPVRQVEDQSLVFEALMTMMQADMRHLAVVDSDENMIGVLSSRDLLMAQGDSPLFVLREIHGAASVAELIAIQERLPRLIRGLISSGAKANHLNRFVTAISDAILEQIIEFVLADSPPPPVPFVFMILGSEGRREQTLKTDQDNAIIFKDVPPDQEQEIQRYFLGLGERICALLDRVGYAFCTGGVMAKNPQWCQPLATWKTYFSDWIHTAEAEDLLQASIFFDFRAGYGDSSFIDALRAHLSASLEGWSGFFRHLTENALHFKPPLGFLRNFVVESKGKHRNSLDIKSAMTPVVDLARIYALKHGIDETNTLDRLHQLQLKNIFSEEQFEELEKAYGFMMQIRLVRQVTAIIDEENPPDNYINPKKLTHIEQTMLKEIFKRVEKYQANLGFEFTGLA
jgi:CBS domain-containing protein